MKNINELSYPEFKALISQGKTFHRKYKGGIINMKKATILIWLIAGLLFSFSMGYITGENAGHRAGILRATNNISYCYENGASGYYTTDKGVRCLYD